MALDESTLLVWHQGSKKGVTVGSIDGPMRFLLIKPKLLTPFEGNLDSLYQEMNDRKDSIKLGGHASVEFELETNRVESDLVAEFPMQVRALDELLLFCRSSVIGAANGMSRANLALLVANPRASTYRLVPQDWFNKGHFDYGYQWATRVVRNPVTRYVHGEGIRIEPFVLDDSLRNLRVE